MGYQEVLRNEYLSRSRANPRYSLRAFARDLDLNSSFLSALLSGKKGLSRARASKLARRLGFTRAEAANFCDLVDMDCARSLGLRQAARRRVEASQSLSLRSLDADSFRIVSDWYHLAIRELLHLPGFEPTAAAIARRLGISETESAEAWERLVRLGLVQRQGKRWAAAEFVASPVDGAPNGDVRKAHRQLTELSLRSLEYEPLSERSHTAVYLPCDASQIETAREMIRDFRRNFEKALFHQRSAVPTRVYCLSVQFFGLDRPETPPLADNSKTGRST